MVQLPQIATLAVPLILGVTALLLLTVDAILPRSCNRKELLGMSGIGTLLAVVAGVWLFANGVGDPAGEGIFTLFENQLIVDQMSLFFGVLVASVTFLVLLASYDYLAGHSYQCEFNALVLLAATGMALMASANSLSTVAISLELASLPSYVLVAFLKRNRGSVEAGLKYFLIGALSTAILIYGVSLVYAVTGSLLLTDIAGAIDAGVGDQVGVLGLGIVMIIGGFLYKTASVPFHFWAPEAYEGAPAPISAFLSSASKAAGFALVIRVLTVAFPLETVVEPGLVDWVLVAQIVAVLTMTLGNFAAATQTRVKRMLAYSSIGHAGYVFIGIAALSAGGNNQLLVGASLLHLFVYGFMNTGAFLFISLTEYWDVGRTFEDFNGLASRAPIASVAMTIFLFSLAGLPVGGGFLTKYALFAGAVNAGFWWLAAVGAINSALSLFYYSRVVKAMWFEESDGGFEITSQPVGIYTAIVVAAIATVALLPAFGVLSGVGFDAAAAVLP
ncbi:MAG: proton-translocating NADH-quinone oxidoreductase chain N [Halobacteriales archaeon]|jgi:proton-translocating NADH-quinone oxidoreductase chain N